MFKLVVATVSLTIAFTVSAQADGPAGDACAAKLTADGKAIYTATMAAKPTTQTLQATMERETKSLASSNKIARGSARDNAIAARDCVRVGLQ